MTEAKHDNLNVEKVSSAVRGAIDSLGNVEMGDMKFNKPTKELLDLSSMTIDVHVAMHPALVAYFGALKKEATRMLSMEKRAYDRWKMIKWAEAKVKSGGEYKPTREDIESRLEVDNAKAIDDWEKRINEFQGQVDDLDAWFEALRQKSFAMRDHVSMEEEERFSTSSSMGRTDGVRGNTYMGIQNRDEMNSEKLNRVRDIISKRRNKMGESNVK